MDTNLLKGNLTSSCNRLQKGQKVKYEGEEAKVIGVKPLLTIKFKDRIICGALHERIEFLKSVTYCYTSQQLQSQNS